MIVNANYSKNGGSWFGIIAKVAELVDALDLGSSGVTRESSSLSFRISVSRINSTNKQQLHYY